MFTFDPVETERLTIRQYTADDLPEVHKLTSDPEVMEFIPCGALSYDIISKAFPLVLERKGDELLTGSQGELPGKLAVQLKASPQAIGYVSFTYLPHVDSEMPEVGYGLQRAFWGNGYATEAARAMFEYGFAHLQLPEIFIAAHPDNVRCLRIIQKLGLTFCKRVPWPKVVVNDIYSMTKQDYETLKRN
jgi:ribosomal-protein-alanine N-acetyltransferase